MRISVIAPVMAVVAVIFAILVTDLAVGGADEPEPENLAYLGPGVAAATLIPPTVVRPSPTPTATPSEPSSTTATTPAPTAEDETTAEVRDSRRKADLESVKDALAEYYEEEDEYPTTEGNIQTLCVYEETDVLCDLEDLLDPIPTDPRGEARTNGYWYASDGKTFTLIAGMELKANADPDDCPESAAKHTKMDNLYCLRGGH